MNEELKVSFYLKRERKNEKTDVDANPIYPIVGKIIIGKSIAQFSSKLKIGEHLWNVRSGRASGKSKIATELNREINKINLSIHSYYKDIFKRTGKVTALEVKNAFQGIASTQTTLLVLFETMLQELHARIGIDRAQATYDGCEVVYKHVKRFIKAKYNVRDIPLHLLDLSFIEAFDFYLRVERCLKPSTVITTIVILLKVAKMALRRNLVAHPPFFGYKLGRAELQNRSLSVEEFEQLISTPLLSFNLNFVRDLFVFASFTGISYTDLKNLTWKEIITEEDGSLWISKSRQKTGIPFNVKLLDISIQIMEKYRGLAKESFVFDVPYLQKINTALKEIAGLCAIKRNLTFHLSRHTFASQICLSQGVPIESVSRMLGHKDIRTTQRYARVNQEKIGNDMKLLSIRLESKFDFLTC
jgi:integrase